MSYSIDANLLIYASDTCSPEHRAACDFLIGRAADPDLLCLTWTTLMAYQRIATHPSIFSTPLDPSTAWQNILGLLALPRTRIITEEAGFADDYQAVTQGMIVRGNLVRDPILRRFCASTGCAACILLTRISENPTSSKSSIHCADHWVPESGFERL
jgi:predicted nucleic acid-binding protein